MNRDAPGIEGISIEQLQRYVAMREKIDIEAENIQSLSSLLALLGHIGDDRIRVDPIALGHVLRMLERNILNIWEYLDDFIYIVQARSELARRGCEDSDRAG